MFAYRSCGRLPCSFPGLLTSGRKLWNHISTLPTTSHLSSSLFNTSRFCAHLLDSPQLSFHLSLSLLLSTPLNSCWLTSPQFHLSIFFSAQSKWHSCKLSCSGQLNCLSIRSWFSTFDCHRLCYHSRVCTIIQSYWTVDSYLWVQRSSMLGPQHLSRARGSSTAARVFESCCLKGQAKKDTQAAQLRAPRECSEAWQTEHSRALFFPASFCYTSKMSPFATFMLPSLHYDGRPSAAKHNSITPLRIRSSKQPWRSHSTAICRDWVAKRNRIATHYCRTHRWCTSANAQSTSTHANYQSIATHYTSLWCTSSNAQSVATHAKHKSTAATKERKSHLEPLVTMRAQFETDSTANLRRPKPSRKRANFSPRKKQCFVQILTFKAHPWCSRSIAI